MSNKKRQEKFQPVDLNKQVPNGKTKSDVAYHFLDIIYNLFGLKQLTYAFVYVILIVIAIFAVKESIREFFYPVASAVKYIDNHYHNSFYNIIVTVIAIISIVGNIIQRKYYLNEINRISKSRKKVMHGRATGNLSALSQHNSSSSKELSKQINEYFSLEDEYNT